MFGSLGIPLSTAGVVRQEERRIRILRDVMSTLYDLDGAVAARQCGVMEWSLQNLVLHTVLYRLAAASTVIPEYARIEQEWHDAISILDSQDPSMASRAVSLYIGRTGEPNREDIASVLAFVSEIVYAGNPMDSATARDEWVAQLATFRAELDTLSRRPK